MAEKTMTQVQALELAVTMVTDEDVRAVLQHMLDTKRKPRAKRENKEAKEFREKIFEVLSHAEGPQKAGEIAAVMEVSPQKVANNLRVLIDEGRVEKIAGEKAKDPATYMVA